MGSLGTINRLPDDIIERLQALLRDKRCTQLEVTAQINALLEAKGETARLSKSTVNRYDLKMREAGAKLSQAREVAKMWIGKLGAAPQGEVGHLVNEVCRTLAFDVALKLQDMELNEETMPEVGKQLRNLSLVIMQLEKASSENVKREDDIRRQERERLKEKTARAVDAASPNGPMTAEELQALIKGVYGA